MTHDSSFFIKIPWVHERIKIMTDFNAFLVEGLLLLSSKKYFHHDEPLDVSTYFMTDDIRWHCISVLLIVRILSETFFNWFGETCIHFINTTCCPSKIANHSIRHKTAVLYVFKPHGWPHVDFPSNLVIHGFSETQPPQNFDGLGLSLYIYLNMMFDSTLNFIYIHFQSN